MTNTLLPLPERVTFSLPAETKEELKMVALLHGRSISSLALLIVNDFLKKEREKKKEKM